MSEKLIERLALDGNKLLMDEKPVIEVPDGEWSSKNQIYFAKADEKGRVIMGTGGCCDGYVVFGVARDVDPKHPIQKFRGLDKDCHISEVYEVPFNVYDVMPLSLRTEDTNFANGSGFLAVGSGCSGAGLRIYGRERFQTPMKEIITSRHYSDITEGFWNPTPRLMTNEDKIYLDIHDKRFTTPEGDTPLLVGFDTKGEYVRSGPNYSRDITHWLRCAGVEIEETIERNKQFETIRENRRK